VLAKAARIDICHIQLAKVSQPKSNLLCPNYPPCFLGDHDSKRFTGLLPSDPK
jgi:hypothetical protein